MTYIFKGNTALIINYLFQTLLITYLILLLAEQIWTGIVSIYINLNYLLVIVIIIGILDVFSEHSIIEKINPTLKDYIFIIILGILGFFIIKYKTTELGWLSWLISIIAGVLIILLSFLVLEDEDETEEIKTTKPKSKAYLFIILGIIIILLVISLILTKFTNLSIIESLRIIFGSIYVLFLPGLIISFIFFPITNHDKKSIDWIERIALSFALSISIVPLTIFYLNLIGIKISLLNSFLTILGIIIICLLILYFKYNYKKDRKVFF